MEITRDNFKDYVLNSKGKVLVDFYADWCGPCKMLSPIIEEIEKETEDIAFFKVNVDKEPELSMDFNVMSIPTLILFNNGEIKNTSVGFMPKEEILEFINE